MEIELKLEIILILLLAIGIGALLMRRRKHRNITPEIRERAAGRFVRLSCGYTHYECGGPENGPVVVLIHGFSVPYHMWDPTFVALVRAGFRVIRYDLYGRGLSDRPRLVYNRRLFVAQLSELLEALAIKEPVYLAGNSMGGAVAAAFAASYPERVGKVVLIAPFSEKFKIGWMGLPVIGELITAVFFVPAAPQAQLQDFYRPERFPEWPERFREQMGYQGFGYALLSTLRNFLNQDPTPDYVELSQAEKPVLLIWGAEDRTLGTGGADKLRRILAPDFLWLEQVGHIPQYECPEIVNPRIIAFLAEHAAAELRKRA